MTKPTDFQGVEEKKVRLADLALAKGLIPYVRPYAWMLGLTTLLVFLVTGFELLLPLITQRAIDGFILPSGVPGTSLFGVEFTTFSAFGLAAAGIILAGFTLDFCQTLFMEYTGQKIILNLRCRLFEHMTGLPVAYFDTHPSGRLVSRVAGDIENMNEMFTSILVFIFKDLLLMAGIFAVLYATNARLAFYLTLILPVIAFTVLYFRKKIREVFRRIRQKIAEINHRFSEGITGIKVIQTTMARERFIMAFKDLNRSHFNAAMDQIRLFAIFMPFIGFMGVLATALILWGGSSMVADATLTLGEMVAFLSYMKLFFRPLRELSEKFNLLQNALASAERIITVLNTAKEAEPARPAPQSAIRTLVFKGVDFSYTPGVPVLNKINFKLEKGESLGIVGPTGAGKSSIINLITGFYPPSGGRILINGQDQARIRARDFRSHTALVMQDPVLFSGSVRENITPEGKPDQTIDDPMLETALAQGNCGFLFDKFLGLDTRLGEGGRPLSSGEKQLVCIARAFASDPDLIIFDEATSYMDSQSETRVHQAMKALMTGRMAIIIAHRLSTVRACDQILVIRDGRIVEHGCHQDLAAMDGEYTRLLRKEQAQG